MSDQNITSDLLDLLVELPKEEQQLLSGGNWGGWRGGGVRWGGGGGGGWRGGGVRWGGGGGGGWRGGGVRWGGRGGRWGRRW